MAVKAASQISIIDVTDAYSVTLTSEAYTFVGNTAGAPSGLSCTTQAVAYCGNTVCKIIVGTITCPIGISASVSNNNTVSPTITFKTTATISAACEATIPLTIDGVTITKKFSFAVAKTGATGASGKGIKSTAIAYQAGASGKTAPTGTWVASPPETTAALPYLWTRTVFTYTDNTTSTSYSVGATPEGIQVGGRNLAQKTSSKYDAGFSKFDGNDNVCFSIGNTLTDGLSVGDVISIKLICKYTNIVSVSGKTPQVRIVGAGNVTGWNDNGYFPVNNYTKLSGSNGEVTIMYQAIINANHVKNSYWNTLLRTDAIQSGMIQCKMFKVERGTKCTDWSPAPEDTEAKIALKVDEKSLKSAIEAIADTINITARGGLNISGNRFTLTSTNTTITADGTITSRGTGVGSDGNKYLMAATLRGGELKVWNNTSNNGVRIQGHGLFGYDDDGTNTIKLIYTPSDENDLSTGLWLYSNLGQEIHVTRKEIWLQGNNSDGSIYGYCNIGKGYMRIDSSGTTYYGDCALSVLGGAKIQDLHAMDSMTVGCDVEKVKMWNTYFGYCQPVTAATNRVTLKWTGAALQVWIDNTLVGTLFE